jgi:hypothetical protein
MCFRARELLFFRFSLFAVLNLGRRGSRAANKKSRRAYATEKFRHFGFEIPSARSDARGQIGNLTERSGALPSGLLDGGNLGRGAGRIARRRLNAAGDVAGGRALLLDCGRYAGCGAGQLLNAARNRGYFVDRFAGRVLDAADLLRDFLGGARGLIGERFDFGGDDRKSLAGAAGPRRSIVALSASRLVCEAIVEMILTMAPIRSALSLSEKTECWVRCVSPTAALAISSARVVS